MPTATPPPGYAADSAPGSDDIMHPDPLSSAVPLANCHVGSFYVLNVRAAPAGEILGWFYGDATKALARTPNWFQIEYHGLVGWVSAHYAIVNGDCG